MLPISFNCPWTFITKPAAEMKVLYFDNLRTLGLNDMSPLHKKKKNCGKNILQWSTSFFFMFPLLRPDQNEEKGNLPYIHLCILHSLLLCIYTNKFFVICALICEHLCTKLLGLFCCCFRESTWHILGNSKTHWNIALNVIKTYEFVVK